MKYLQITHIPFFRDIHGIVYTDELWAKDLLALVAAVGPVRVAAPEYRQDQRFETWGPSIKEIPDESMITFRGFSPVLSRRDFWRWPFIYSVLRQEIDQADVVHSSNVFPYYENLLYGHEYAGRQNKKTVFVIAEDFYDMLMWEWVRTAPTKFKRYLRQKHLDGMESRTRQAIRCASVTFLNTPATVNRYRLDAKNGFAIRLATHHKSDVISSMQLEQKCEEILNGVPLKIVAVARNRPLKGLDLLIRSIEKLRQDRISVEVCIYGAGPWAEGLKTLAEELAVDARIQFMGSVLPGSPLFKAMEAGYIFAMPHRTNDFGRTCLDAMAGGTPTIAFKTSASVETIYNERDGILVPLDNVIAFAGAIERLHYDRPFLVRLVRQAHARALIETEETWQKYRASLIEELF